MKLKERPLDFQVEELTDLALSQVNEPYTSQAIRGNRFRITLRAIKAAEIPGIEQTLVEIRSDGVLNYFDDQRFGSVGQNGKFVAKYMVLGQYEEALKLALAT